MGDLGIESGVYQSGSPVRPEVCYPHGYQAHSPNLTESARWNFLLFKMESAQPVPFLPQYKEEKE